MSKLATAQKEGYVIGLNDESGVYPRREIDDLMRNDPDCFNLFILALEQIMKDEGGKQNKMNYFQIAGIHGLPLSNWDGVQNPTANGQGSYCNHASFLFPSWHRPYLAMMEQTLYSNMKDIAARFSDTKYTQAVKRFRLPFWDWIKPREKRNTEFPGVGRNSPQVSYRYNYDLPAVVMVARLKVFRPETPNKLVEIDNPFAKYTFPTTGSIPLTGKGSWASLEQGDDEENEDRIRERGPNAPQMVHASRKRTVRQPFMDFSEQDGLGRVNQSLNMMRESTVENALNLILLKDYNNYLDFAAEAPRWNRDHTKRQGPSGSLEDIHNRYHGLTGGNGHMGRVPVAAFDPIFWLHHCNIDRMLTIWQAVHSGSNAYLPSGKGEFGQDLSLWPFRKDGKNSFWTSAMVQDHKVFGYTYADVTSKDGRSLPKTEILNRWNDNYRWSLQSNDLTGPPDWMTPVDARTAQALDPNDPIFTMNDVARGIGSDGIVSQTVSFMKAAVEKPLSMISSQTTEPAHEMERPAVMPDDQSDAPAPVILDSQVPQVQALLTSDVEALPTIQWYVDVEVQRDAFNGAFTIFYFIGTPSEMASVDADPSSYSVAHILAGSTHVFTAPRQACDACNILADSGTVVTGTSPITPMLRDYVANAGLLEGLAPEQVVPFLKKNLYWRVQAINNISVDPTEMPFLKVEVSSVMAAQKLHEGVPVASETREYPEVAEGRRGGNPIV